MCGTRVVKLIKVILIEEFGRTALSDSEKAAELRIKSWRRNAATETSKVFHTLSAAF
jgi:hypothetical protein